MTRARLLGIFLSLTPLGALAQGRVVVPQVILPNAGPIVPVPLAPSGGAVFAPAPVAHLAPVPLVPGPVELAPAAPLARSESGPLAVARARALRLIITGPPGSGKGTYAQRLSQDFGPVHLSAGALLREYAKARPDVARVMNEGKLVPAELVIRLMRERLSQPDVRQRGFLLDGFPRRLEEAQELERMLDELGLPLDGVVFLDVPEAELLRRILQRGRADDTEETFRERMRVYEAETKPVIEFLRRRARFLEPSVAHGDADGAYLQVRRVVDGL